MLADILRAAALGFDAAAAPCVVRTATVVDLAGHERQVLPEDWFAEDPAVAEQVVLLCRWCTVREACLADAMTAEAGKGRASRYGIFGGLDRDQRHALAKEGAA